MICKMKSNNLKMNPNLAAHIDQITIKIMNLKVGFQIPKNLINSTKDNYLNAFIAPQRKFLNQ